MIFPSTLSILIGIFFGAFVSFIAYRVRALDLSGAIAAAILGTLILGLGGWSWAVVLMIFFVSSSALSIAFKRKKLAYAEMHSKGNRRDAWQVLANGGVAGLIVIMHAFFPDKPALWIAFCASLAAATADTWASEIGPLSRSLPRLISNWKTVEMGTSGGITTIGTLAAATGSLLIAVSGMIFRPGLQSLVLISFAGLFGSLVDSLLGATVQAGFRCMNCQKDTEKHPLHGCGGQTVLIHGYTWLNNDVVNLACTLSASIVGLLLAA